MRVGESLRIENNVVVGCRQYAVHVEIPAGVTGIAPQAFKGTSVRTITIPPGLREVGTEAFQGCTFLEEAVFPSGLERIGENAFEGCWELRRVVLPETLKEMPWNVFSLCFRLKDVKLSPENPFWCLEENLLWRRDHSTLVWFSDGSCQSCRVPEGFSTIPPHTFELSPFRTIILPASVESIGKDAMKACRNLTTLRLPAGLRSIGESALAGCPNLKKLVLPDTLEALDDCALGGTGVRVLVLPASLRYLGTNVFQRSKLCRLVMLGELPEEMKTLGHSRFGIQDKDFDLQADRIPLEKMSHRVRDFVLRNFVRRWNSGESIPEEAWKNRLEYIRRHQADLRKDPAFQNILLDEKLVSAREIDGFLAEALEANDPELTARLLEYQEKHIDREEKARLEEKKLKAELRALTRPEPTMQELKRMWPGKVLEDGSWEIRGYGDLSDTTGELTVPASLKNMPVTSIAAWAFSPKARGRRKTMGAVLNSLKRVRISEGIRLQENAFYGCASLEWVHLPEGLEELPEGIFESCSKLDTVELPSTLKRIRACCFWRCEYLEHVTLPEGLEELGDKAFWGCANLRSIRLPRSLRSVGAEAFGYCSSLTKVEVEPGMHLENLGKEAFHDCIGLERIGVLAGLRLLPKRAFAFCTSLLEIDLGADVISMGEEVFSNCRSLKRIALPPGLTELPEKAFKGCRSLESVSFQPGLRHIGNSAFDDCRSLQEVNLSDIRTTLGEAAFCYSSGLTKVVLPPTLTEIPANAFKGCWNLRSVVLPEGLREIGNSAFQLCPNLRELVLPDSLTAIGEDAFPDGKEFCVVATPLSYGARWARQHRVRLREMEPAGPRKAPDGPADRKETP